MGKCRNINRNMKKSPVFSIIFCLNVHSSETKRARDICFFVRKVILCCMRVNQRVGAGEVVKLRESPTLFGRVDSPTIHLEA